MIEDEYYVVTFKQPVLGYKESFPYANNVYRDSIKAVPKEWLAENKIQLCFDPEETSKEDRFPRSIHSTSWTPSLIMDSYTHRFFRKSDYEFTNIQIIPATLYYGRKKTTMKYFHFIERLEVLDFEKSGGTVNMVDANRIDNPQHFVFDAEKLNAIPMERRRIFQLEAYPFVLFVHESIIDIFEKAHSEMDIKWTKVSEYRMR